MVVTYSKDSTSTSITVGTKYISGRFGDTYNSTRGFTKYDLSSWGLVLADIVSVTWNFYVTYSTGSRVYRLRSSLTGWGATLDATAGDFTSTNNNLEDSQTLNSTGWKSFSVNKNNLTLSGMNYFRLAVIGEWLAENNRVNFSSQNSSTNKPYLEFTMADGSVIKKYSPHAGI